MMKQNMKETRVHHPLRVMGLEEREALNAFGVCNLINRALR